LIHFYKRSEVEIKLGQIKHESLRRLFSQICQERLG